MSKHFNGLTYLCTNAGLSKNTVADIVKRSRGAGKFREASC